MQAKCKVLFYTLILTIGIVNLISGLCLLFGWSSCLPYLLSLTYNPFLFKTWKDVPIYPRTEFYFFNWTNPEDINNSTIKPKFEQVGPYVFYQKEEKHNITWNNNGTITFQLRKFWFYDKSSDLEEKITTLNPVVPALASVTKNWNSGIRKAVLLLLSSYLNKVHITYSARELLFDGYYQPMLKIGASLPFLAHLELPKWNRFGWLYTKNGSYDWDGTLNMGTGVNYDLGKIYEWDFKNHTGYFPDGCGKVDGTTGEIFPQNVPKTVATVFSTDLRRYLSFKYQKESVIQGVPGYTYNSGNYTFDNGSIYKENRCFCEGECLPSGIYNVSTTRNQMPIFLSLPHFYGADPIYLSQVDGLQPDRVKHDCEITIEPITGGVLEGVGRVQANFLLEPIKDSKVAKLPRMIFPVLWASQSATIPLEESLLIRVFLFINKGHFWIGLALVVTSILLIFLIVFIRNSNQLQLQYRQIPAILLKNKLVSGT